MNDGELTSGGAARKIVVRRRLRTAAATVTATAVLAAAVVVASGAGGDGDSPVAAADLPPRTEEVRRETLRETRTQTGTLGYGRARLLAPREDGTVTWLPEAGDVIRPGATLYGLGEEPVVLLRGAVPAYRRMARGMRGRDVAQLEKALAASGYRGFTVDRVFAEGTADAVRAWQRRVGLPVTGAVELGQVMFGPGDVRVSALSVSLGDPVRTGQAVLSLTGTEPLVTVPLDVADQRLAKKGAAVTVHLPDGTAIDGTIASVTTVVETDEEKKQVTVVEVQVRLKSRADGFDSAAVDVTFSAGERENVLTVPVVALLALAEGGYGVEVVDGTRHTVVAVETGLFAGGRVEVTGGGVAEGTRVGVPS
jgi:peptidoglycan hydrolase-like protein with peptidoglycan-binding domain